MLQSPSVDLNVSVSALRTAFFFGFIYIVSFEDDLLYLRNSAVVNIALVFLLRMLTRL